MNLVGAPATKHRPAAKLNVFKIAIHAGFTTRHLSWFVEIQNSIGKRGKALMASHVHWDAFCCYLTMTSIGNFPCCMTAIRYKLPLVQDDL